MSGLNVEAVIWAIIGPNYSHFYVYRHAGCVKGVNGHGLGVMIFSSQGGGSGSKGAGNGRGGTMGGPKLPVDKKGNVVSKWCNMDQELVNLCSEKGKEGSNTKKSGLRPIELRGIAQLKLLYDLRESRPGYWFGGVFIQISRLGILSLSASKLKNRLKVSIGFEYGEGKIKALRESLRSHSYTAGVRKVDDVIVQTAIALVLSAILEPKLSKYCFSSRAGIKCHNVFFSLKIQFKGVDCWFEGNFWRRVPKLNPYALQVKLENYVRDPEFFWIY